MTINLRKEEINFAENVVKPVLKMPIYARVDILWIMIITLVSRIGNLSNLNYGLDIFPSSKMFQQKYKRCCSGSTFRDIHHWTHGEW
jgi:hypothetical protein